MSCTTTFRAVSSSYYDSTVATISEQLSEKGFTLSGTANETKNEVSVSGTSYSYYTGYGSAMKNNYWQYQEYSYLDSDNNSVSYTVKFQLKKDSKGQEYVQDLSVSNCSASKDYNTICGMNGIVQSNMQNTINNPDAVVTVVDQNSTILGVTLGGLGVALLLTLLLVLL